MRLPPKKYRFLVMRLLFLVLLFFQLATLTYAQNNPINAIDHRILESKKIHFQSIPDLALWISSNFETDQERLRAAFSWVANSIYYDFNAYNEAQQAEQLPLVIAQTFIKKKAVCEGFAGLMDSLSRLMDIPSVKVNGYTRNNGQLDPTPHMWVASYVDGKWWLSDPTWASGSIVNNRFVKAYEPSYFMRHADSMLHTHMPYDPLWQLLTKPLSHKGFIEQNNQLRLNPINPEMEISRFMEMDQIMRYQHELDRIQNQKINHPALTIRIDFLKQSIQVLEHNSFLQALQQVIVQFNNAVSTYNQLVDRYNRNPDRKENNHLLQEAVNQLEIAIDAFNKLGQVPISLRKEQQLLAQNLKALQKNIRDFENR